MGTFPAASDYPTPIPQPANDVASAPPITLSDAPAQAQAALGQQLKTFGSEVDRYGEHIDTLQAQDALNQIRAKRDDLTTGDNGFMKLQGLNVTKPGDNGVAPIDNYKQQFDTASSAITKGLSPRAMMMITPKLAEEREAFTVEFGKHSIQQTEVANKSVYADGQQQNLTDAARNAGDPQALALLAERAKSGTLNYTSQAGLPSDALVASNVSNIYRTGIESMFSSGDMAGAVRLYGQTKQFLDGKDSLEVGRAVKSASQGLDALSWGAQKFSGAPVGPAGVAGLDNNTGNISASNISYSGKTAPAGNFETFATPEHGVAAAYGTIVAKAQQNGGAISFHDLIAGNSKVQGYAPADDGKTPMLAGNDPVAYATRLAKSVGLGPNDPVPLGDDAKMATILREQNIHEKGHLTVGEDKFARGIALYKGDQGVAASLTPQGDDATPTGVTPADTQAAQGAAPVVLPPAQPPIGPAIATPPPSPVVAPTSPPDNPNDRSYFNVNAMKIDLQKQRMAAEAQLGEGGANPDVIAKRRAALDMIFSQREHAIDLGKLQLDQAANAWVDQWRQAGSDVSKQMPPQISDQLSPRERESYMRMMTYYAGGKKIAETPTNRTLFSQMNDFLSDNPDRAHEINMAPYVSTLTTEQYNHIQERKDQIISTGQKDYDTTKALNMMKNSLALKGVDTRDNAGDDSQAIRGQMNGQLLDWLGRFKDANKRAPKDAEVRQQIDNMLIEGRTDQPGFFSFFGEAKQAQGAPNAKGATGNRGTTPGNKFLATVPQGDLDKFYVPYKQIPADVRDELDKAAPPSSTPVPVPGIGESYALGANDQSDRERWTEKAYMAYLASKAKGRR